MPMSCRLTFARQCVKCIDWGNHKPPKFPAHSKSAAAVANTILAFVEQGDMDKLLQSLNIHARGVAETLTEVLNG